MMKSSTQTRRRFLKESAVAAGLLYMKGFDKLFAGASQDKSKVVLIRDKDALDKLQRPVPSVIENMINKGVTKLTDSKSASNAWKKLINPDDIVGIKTNVWRNLPTTSAVEQALRNGVLSTGVPEHNIGIRDHGVLDDPIFRKATALINARPMRTHHWAGVGTLIKNYIMFYPTPSEFHPDSCADLAKLWSMPIVKGKTRLNILVMFTPLFHGIGPHHFSPEYTWAYNGLLLGFDPVAVDAMGIRILQAKRNEYFGEERPLNPPPKHIYLADTRHHLGTADPDKIELIKLGWEQDILI